MKIGKTLLTSLFVFYISASLVFAKKNDFEKDIKEAKKEIKEKAIKDARKDAKKLGKEGYSHMPGDLSMEKQLERSMILTIMSNDNGQKKYYNASQIAKAETFAAAKQQALQLAIADIASQLGSNLLGKIKSSVANSENLTDAASITEVIAGYQNTVAAKLGRIDPVVVIQRVDKSSKLTYVQVRIFYDMDAAAHVIKEDLRKELKAKTKEIHDEIDALFKGL